MYFKGFLSVWLEVQIQYIKKRAVIQIFSTVYFYILTGEPQGLPNHVQYHGVPLSFALYLDRFLLICIKVTNPPKNKGKYSHFKTNTHICNIFSQKISSLLIDQVTIILKVILLTLSPPTRYCLLGVSHLPLDLRYIFGWDTTFSCQWLLSSFLQL